MVDNPERLQAAGLNRIIREARGDVIVRMDVHCECVNRVFAEDVLACPCGGRRRVLCFITDTDVAREILTALDLPATIPTFAPARAPPTFDDWKAPAPDDNTGGEIRGHPVDHPPDDFGDPPAWDQSDSA